MAFRPIKNQSTNQTFRPFSSEEASRVKPALTIDQLIAEKRAGEILPESQPFAAFSRGALDSALAGSTEAAGSLAGANPEFDPNSPQFTNPNLYSAGEIAGSFFPLGRVAKGVKVGGSALKNLVKEGMRVGGIYGAGQGVSEEARKEAPETGAAIEALLARGATGAAFGGAIPFVAGASIKSIPTKQNILDDLSKTSRLGEGKMQRSASGGYVKAADKITPFLKKDSGVHGFIDAADAAMEKEASIFKPIIEGSSETYFQPDNIYAAVDKKLAQAIPNPDTRRELLLNSGDFLSDLMQINPKNFLQYTSKINKEVGRIYKNPSTPITQEGLAAKEAIRDAYADVIEKILLDSGENPDVYSGYGAMRELQSQIGKNYLVESTKLSEKRARGPIQNLMTGLEEGGGGGFNIPRGIQSMASRISEGEKGRLDNQVNKLVDGFLGYSREKTDASKAEKLSSALQILNTLNKNTAEPTTTIEELIKQSSN